MAEVQPRFGWPGLQVSFTCAEAIVGGQLVERRTGSRLVGVAGANSVRVAGVARWDVPAARASIQGPQVGDGNELVVARCVVIPVTFTGAAVAGDPLVATAAGQVTPAGAAPDARFIVGQAFEDVGAGAVGLAYIF